MEPGDTVTLNPKHHLRDQFYKAPALDGPATIIHTIGSMHRVAFHKWVATHGGSQFMPWIHEDDLVLVAP